MRVKLSVQVYVHAVQHIIQNYQVFRKAVRGNNRSVRENKSLGQSIPYKF